MNARTRPQQAATESIRMTAAADPDPRPSIAEPQLRAQSLADGAAGHALAQIERAHHGQTSWRDAHHAVTAAASGDINSALDTGLMVGVTAIAFLLHAAGADGTPRYGPTLATLDPIVTKLAHQCVDLAHARIDRRELPTFAEYDLLHGLTGIGAHLLRHDSGSDALDRILTYLVRLTQPLRVDGDLLPGWWTGHDPARGHTAELRGGHGNFGLAHGIAGPLALLAQALRAGITVNGHTEAIATIHDWLDTWRHESDTGVWWPQWITRDQQRTRRPDQHGPLRPSWCYGTPGLARAQQLAGIATGDHGRQQLAENALTACLADPAQLDQITDAGLCHGWAGLYQTTWRAAWDALTPAVGHHLPHLADRLTEHADAQMDPGLPLGLLEGSAGIALALDAAATDIRPITRWDSALLLD